MRSYVILLNWTDQGVKNSRDTIKRAGAFRALIQSRGGKVREHLYTLGEYDIVMVTEFPDDDTAAAAVLALASLGNVRTKTTRAFTDDEVVAITAQLG
ncbi:MAG TPA: GYD domain-containing protein [Streptosporangiaceae bacterium]|nr:GYD domain-containing protein [Streptosporangiaceae bacterium]